MPSVRFIAGSGQKGLALPMPRFLARLGATIAAACIAAQPAAAQSILRDAETEALLRDMAAPLIVAAGLDPKNVDVVLINDSDVNAFVAGGQAVYINSGLINAAGSANEVQGVIAHELGHVTGGHAISDAGGKAATGISLLSLLLGAAAAAAGGGDAAMGMLMAGQQAAMGKYLAFSRGQESAADAAGAQYLSHAGITGRGSIAFFKKLENMDYRAGYSPKDDDVYYSTHPMTGDRIASLQDIYEKDPAWSRPSDASIEARFQRARAKLYGYLAKPQDALVAYPETTNTVPARYARAYAWHKEAQLDKSMAETDALLKAAPADPYFLELKGQILLEAGKPGEALPLSAARYRHHREPAADRHDLRPCADRDRRPQELRRGRTRAQGGGSARPREPVRLVPARRGLCRQRRSSARAPRQRRTAGHGVAHAAGAGQRASGGSGPAQRLARLAAGTGYRHAGARRD